MTDLAIRPAGADDLDAVIAIEQACFANPWPRSAFELALGARGVAFLAARHEGELVGYVVAAHLGADVLIADIAVSPTRRRCGVGSTLLEWILDWAAANGARRCRLEVRQSNAGAIGLYQRHGFAELGRIPGYYRNPAEDAISMVRNMPEHALSQPADGAAAAPDPPARKPSAPA